MIIIILESMSGSSINFLDFYKKKPTKDSSFLCNEGREKMISPIISEFDINYKLLSI